MQNPIQKFGQSAIVWNQVFCLKIWKLWRDSTTLQFNSFCWNFTHVSYLPMSTKGCVGFYFILFRSWVINKNVKSKCVETRSFYNFIDNPRSKQNKKNPRHAFVDIGK